MCLIILPYYYLHMPLSKKTCIASLIDKYSMAIAEVAVLRINVRE